uniref:Uncharacterized protein n=1 Tax=Chromera velia CCMP2878 TaxID=1169474 RepID=A0A0G4HN73_9ALVE|mmetsp:Transcript_4326/g.8764  ORF Transcript_4326/g.8764 Transcript_4326/m.8764 type:complete len:121 (+) Transcript_4326:287-649(+)|eukprot:Cvel_1191.t1-p1 / transcript=Cvel_1191.t1 / gene=Cvel_1191 / organism=Chromera_velia_CCMP2878 / gene_product=hypothetical protein / transcript_product=hypothetical protein / location=Cvel_scaffold39:139716-140075(+) / protein_length=120 / sequence_SO=supercontig / SO=protein_coding / is_pseudo=false
MSGETEPVKKDEAPREQVAMQEYIALLTDKLNRALQVQSMTTRKLEEIQSDRPPADAETALMMVLEAEWNRREELASQLKAITDQMILRLAEDRRKLEEIRKHANIARQAREKLRSQESR